MYTHIYISIGIDLQGYPCMEIQYSHIYICIHPIQKSISPKYYFWGIVASTAQRVTSLSTVLGHGLKTDGLVCKA